LRKDKNYAAASSIGTLAERVQARYCARDIRLHSSFDPTARSGKSFALNVFLGPGGK